jgi:hypothetical protein
MTLGWASVGEFQEDLWTLMSQLGLSKGPETEVPPFLFPFMT